MNPRVVAFYPDRTRARLAADDLRSAGVESDRIRLNEDLEADGGTIEVLARNSDHAIDVKAWLDQDGAEWTELRPGLDEEPPSQTIPRVPA